MLRNKHNGTGKPTGRQTRASFNQHKQALTRSGLQFLNEPLADEGIGEVGMALEESLKECFVGVVEVLGKLVEP